MKKSIEQRIKEAKPHSKIVVTMKEFKEYILKCQKDVGHIVEKHVIEPRIVINETKEDLTICDKAKAMVYGDRAAAYGHPNDNFQNCADLFNTYKDICTRRAFVALSNMQAVDCDLSAFTTTDVAILNILQKVARLATNPTHIDSVTDIAGYAATIERIITNK